jgi:predicted nucleic acid-binding protein
VGPDAEATGLVLGHQQAVLPPVVLAELLSDRHLRSAVRELFLGLPLLEIMDGYWERVGLLRARLLARGRKVPLADTLIAQSCLDHDVELVTRDADFEHGIRAVGLRLFSARAGR